MLVINEIYVNETRGWIFGESGIYQPFTDDLKEVFRGMQKEYGRCISKMYLESPDGEVRPVGWVFEKRKEYSDSDDTYLQHTWVRCKHIEED
ncbi:MAG: hypothetical protein AB1512_02825 [Thermodesulfobacteriota bacterium]